MQYPLSWQWNGSTWTTVAGPLLTNVFDEMGRLKMLKEGTTDLITGTAYNAAGQLTAMTGANGAPSESRTYNSIGQMKQLSVGSMSIKYNYYTTEDNTHNNGKIVSEQDMVSGETVTYTYDSLNRLASATSSDNPGWGQSYTYDGFGNLTQQNVTKGTAPSLNVTYNASTNRRTTDCADANGNIGAASASCSEGYSYDAANRITAVGSTAYSYAPNNQRVYNFTGAGRELTYYGAGGQKLTTYSLNNNGVQPTAVSTGRFYYFGGKLIKNAGGYVTPDRLGSIGKYFPYGQERPSATTNNKEKFATYYRDSETGLDYANNRYHQPGHGRFLTADPYGGSATAGDPGSWNRYSYVGGDPVNRGDPSGLFWGDIWGWIGNNFGSEGYNACNDPACVPFSQNFTGDMCWMNVGACQMPYFYEETPQMGMGSRDTMLNSPASARPAAEVEGHTRAGIEQALTMLGKPSCANLFNGDDEGGAYPDPADVLRAITDGTGYASLAYDYMGDTLDGAGIPIGWTNATTRGDGYIGRIDGLPQFSSATITINTNASTPLNYGASIQDHAVTMLHELGHVYQFLFGQGSTSILYDNPETNPGVSQNNTALIARSCL